MMPQTSIEVTAHSSRPADEIVRALNALIIANAGSADVMLAAASEVDDARVQDLFESVALTRQGHARRLAEIVDANGHEAPESPGLTDTLRAYWITLHGALTDGAPEKILSDALPAEEKIEAAYETALEAEWSPPLDRLLRQQLAVIKAQHARIVELHAQHATA